MFVFSIRRRHTRYLRDWSSDGGSSDLFNIKKDSIVRAVVMLEDWQPGQIILIDNKSYSGWKSGEYWCWKNDTKHSFYNMSIFDRYSLQITGTILE